ncbi:MAG: acyl-CoA dehydrogenase family protein [Cyanobacteriota bacterium]|nr:acyl-CoA dehydrogenase family protein [Cyanobacteriota bacterium]
MVKGLQTSSNLSSNPLEDARSYLQACVAPQADRLDGDRVALREALMGLADRGLLTLRFEAGADVFAEYQETIARYSGALAFLQTQHQSAAAMVAASSNESLKRDYLPHLATGDRLLGVGFSQLRRSGPPPVRAHLTDGGYQIDGEVPWVTGWGYFQEFIVGAMLPDGRSVFGIVPLVPTDRASGGSIEFGEPMQLNALSATNTVTARLENWLLSSDRVVSLKPTGWMETQGMKNVLNHSFFALGCARAGLDIVEEAAQRKQQPFIFEAFAALDRELKSCREQIFARVRAQETSLDAIALRAEAIDLAVRCAHAAVTVSSGAANYSHHRAGRVYREALVYTVSGQTTAVMEATLARLVGG